jgi:penicillin amidase
MNPVRGMLRTALGKRLPITKGLIEVPGVRDKLVIGRDEYGVAYIEASNDADAWFGLGFVHGQDRAFQMESLLRVVRGTLAALVGESAVPIDRLSRRIGFRRSALTQIDTIDPDIRETLDAYAAGAYQGATTGSSKPAHEFVLLKGEPTPYEAADALGLMKLMSFLLASNWDAELVRYKILTEDGPEALKDLDPTYPEWLPAIVPPGKPAGPVIDRLADDLERFQASIGGGGGSNNWAISGARTASGNPIVANDPHLAPTMPSHWYLAHVATPDWQVAGATLLGSPGFPVGFNGHAAWGVTAGLTDNTDLFLEEVGEDGTSIRIGDEFVPCTVHHETIEIKDGDPVTIDVLETPHGPLVGPSLDGEVAVSMRAVWLDDAPTRGILALHEARTVAGLKEAYRCWPGLPLNIVSADVTGSIAWQLVGELPVREQGWGTLPSAGWIAGAGWKDERLSVDELPGIVDPGAGFIATANNKPVTGDADPFIGFDFLDGYRAARITERLDAVTGWSLSDVGELQMDLTSIPWREMRSTVLSLYTTDPDALRAIEVLAIWDGIVDPESSAGGVYEFFVTGLTRRVVSARAPHAAAWALGRGLTVLTPETGMGAGRMGHLVRLLREQPDGWFERGWDTEISDALAIAITTLEKDHGTDPEGWKWGSLRPLTVLHPLGEKKPLDRIYNLGPFPWGGDSTTVSQAGLSFMEPTANPGVIASLRMAVEVGEWDNNRFILPGGQSGNPMSPHYADQLDLYRSGGAIRIAWSPADRASSVQGYLEIRPT